MDSIFRVNILTRKNKIEKYIVYLIISMKTTSSKGASYHFSGYKNLPIGSQLSLNPKTKAY